MLTEEAVLGTLLKFPHLLTDTDLKPRYFQYAENRNVLQAMKELNAKGQVVDLITMLTQGRPENFGGAGKLNKIQNLANEEKFDSYVGILLDKWREREKYNILEVAKHENWPLEKITNELNSLVSNNTDDHNSINELVMQVAEDPWKPMQGTKGIPTGLEALQTATNGWQNTDLIIVAARPSMGKTDFMLHCVKQAGWQGCLPIVFSLEMSAAKLRDRMIASTGNYNRNKMKNLYERLTEGQKESWMKVIAQVSKTNVEIFDKSGQTISEMRMKIRKIRNQNPDKQLIIFIDYLTLIKPSDESKSMHLSISEISKALKAIGKEFNCPVISLAQLSRGVEKRPDKRPMLSDLRESGSIEEDADVVVFLYRDAYYSKNDEEDSLEIIIAKNREGEVGTVNSKFNRWTGVVSDVQ
ncbi:replicative DNA helicase [Lysinibacillus fusiformis]|uniref:replicative DNA helicase n=1 Tax=Lysinibacillus fusiformis TaxID=28031 RepID=UPI003D06D837